MSEIKSLILLTSPPSKVTPKSISTAYRPSLVSAISGIDKVLVGTELLVAVDWSIRSKDRLWTPRAELFHDAQELLGRLYSLICKICDELEVDIDLELPGSINPRIILLDCSDVELKDGTKPCALPCYGPFLELRSLAYSSFHYQTVSSVANDEGQKLLAQYHRYKQQESLLPKCDLLGNISSFIDFPSPDLKSLACTTHKVVAVGGTFDHLHVGHKILLTATALLLQPSTSTTPSNLRLIVGITGDELLKNKKHAEYLRSWKQRQGDVVEFLLSFLLFTHKARKDLLDISTLLEPESGCRTVLTRIETCSIIIECTEIKDPFGPTITDESITALVVSHETRSGGSAVNKKRIEKGLQALEVYEIEVLDTGESQDNLDEDFSTKISSSQIRKRKSELGYQSFLK